MKLNFFLIVSLLLLQTSCSIDNVNNDNPEITLVTWHLINTTGGIAGVDHQFSLDSVIWAFNNSIKSLAIENKNTDDTKQDLLESGTYNFSITTIDDNNYIFINDIEYVQVIIESATFTIDENSKTTGEVTDGFVYTFQKVETKI